jgi:hypothetical protein
MASDYVFCPRVEKYIMSLGTGSQMGKTSAGFLKFFDVFNPNESIVRKSFEYLVRCLHGGFLSP